MSQRDPSLIDQVPELEIHQQSFLNFMSHFEPFLLTVTQILGRNLGRDFDGSGQFVPAAILFDPLVADHVFWIDSNKEYGKSRADDALSRLRRFERWLSKTKFEDLPDSKKAKIVTGICRLSGPLYFFVTDAVRSLETIQLRSAIQFLVEHQEKCLLSQTGSGGKYRALRTAVALRAIFETHSDIPITEGDKHGAPSGVFCTCLEELFHVGRIEGGFRHYARKAKERSSDDPLLLRFVKELREAPLRVAAIENR